MPYIPHTEEDVKSMLASIGVADIHDLFDEIPSSLQQQPFKNLPSGLNEMAMLNLAQQLANQNQSSCCFMGAGSYDHHIPAAVWDVATRGEFYTAYTPYQAEASQGTLQLLYEFQTMIAELTGMEVANASMYDGASALAEAILMAVRIHQHHEVHRILVAGTVHPSYRETIKTIVCNQQIEIITLPIDPKLGITSLDALKSYQGEEITALVIAQPNFFGCLELVDELADWAHHHQTICIACVNPISLALLKPPAAWGEHGADIVCGEGQPLGIPMSSGGPYFGFFSTRLKYVRQMPGRIVGRTQDKDGQIGYTLTLQAREQHIRRAKATSNICTNQGLMVTAATIYLSLLGAEGLAQVATQCHQKTNHLVSQLTQLDGVALAFTAPYFHEAVLKFKQPVDKILATLRQHGIEGGYPLCEHDTNLPNTLLICATEKRTDAEIDLYVQLVKSSLEHEPIC